MPTYRYMTENQAQYITDLVNARFETDDDAGRGPWRERFQAIRTSADIGGVINDLKRLPTLAQLKADRDRAERAANRITEPGYYRNPEDGKLYRVAKTQDGLRVHEYSKTGGPRRLTVEGNLVKGTWKRHAGFASRRLLLSTVRKDWAISEQALTDYAYGFCPLHGGPLSDGVSVALGYGPKCASNHGLPWSEEAARTVLVTQGIDPDKFLAEHAGNVEG